MFSRPWFEWKTQDNDDDDDDDVADDNDDDELGDAISTTIFLKTAMTMRALKHTER